MTRQPRLVRCHESRLDHVPLTSDSGIGTRGQDEDWLMYSGISTARAPRQPDPEALDPGVSGKGAYSNSVWMSDSSGPESGNRSRGGTD
jgi:hypothetical protein